MVRREGTGMAGKGGSGQKNGGAWTDRRSAVMRYADDWAGQKRGVDEHVPDTLSPSGEPASIVAAVHRQQAGTTAGMRPGRGRGVMLQESAMVMGPGWCCSKVP